MTGSATRWLVIQTVSPSVELTALLSEGFVACGASAVIEEGPMLRTWLPGEDGEEIVERVRATLRGITGDDIELTWEWQDDRDWLQQWRAGLEPRRIGQHLVVAPSWTTPDAGDDDLVIVIDPQMAFGTGEHASTRGILRLLESASASGANVLDVGTGSAVLAIAAGMLGATHIDAVDSDADALINARENIERNGVSDRITLSDAVVDAKWLRKQRGSYDLIVANVLSGILMPLLPAFREAMRDTGDLLLAGILLEEAASMMDAATRAGFRLVAEDREDEWWSGWFAPETA
jgi:ribosomal protein L11 methyltransferase